MVIRLLDTDAELGEGGAMHGLQNQLSYMQHTSRVAYDLVNVRNLHVIILKVIVQAC